MNPVSMFEMRWWHGVIIAMLGWMLRMLSKHVKRVDAHFKLNGYSVDVKKDAEKAIKSRD